MARREAIAAGHPCRRVCEGGPFAHEPAFMSIAAVKPHLRLECFICDAEYVPDVPAVDVHPLDEPEEVPA